TRWAAIHLGLPSPAGSSGLPAGIGRAILKRLRGPPQRPFLALLRVGFAEPPRSPEVLVGSYPTVSPLPAYRPAVCFLWHFPAGHPGLLLATTLPDGVRTFLGGGAALRRRGRPTDSSVASSLPGFAAERAARHGPWRDRKSTRLNSSHVKIS